MLAQAHQYTCLKCVFLQKMVSDVLREHVASGRDERVRQALVDFRARTS